ncbi:MAG TPA: futalosine hydrolase [Chitinophagaceae bacterium]|nr:futalosine hydrolase [Chitinophagaceae bacterium]
MVKIIIVCATQSEMQALQVQTWKSRHELRTALSGIGVLSASYYITELCRQKPDLLIQAGIGGYAGEQLSPGEVCIIEADRLGDLGAEDQHNFLDTYDLKLEDENNFPFEGAYLKNPYLNTGTFPWPLRKAYTVNTCSGSEKTVQHRRKHFPEHIESMEGAALHFICLQNQIPFIQFRAISNRVEIRNRDSWKVQEALTALHLAVQDFVLKLPS